MSFEKKQVMTFLFMTVTLGLFTTNSSLAKVPEVRVKIGHKLSSLVVEGVDLMTKVIGKSMPNSYVGKKIFKFKCQNVEKSFKSFRNRKSPLVISEIESKFGILKWDKVPYRGQFLVLTSENWKGCDLVNRVPLESYISSLLAKEMSANWPVEALKAQAIAARTYAYHKIKSQQVSKTVGYDVLYDLESSEKHQVGGHYFDETKSTNIAAWSTKGQILVSKNNKLTPIFYHSKCGGRTLGPEMVWDSKVDGQVARPCPYCKDHGRKNWNYQLSVDEMREVMSVIQETKKIEESAEEKKLTLVEDKFSRNVFRVYEDDVLFVLKKPLIRKVLGRKKIPSNNFVIVRTGDEFTIIGEGNGHGVGMCQYGAFEMAKRGMNHKQILAHYFPHYRLKKIY